MRKIAFIVFMSMLFFVCVKKGMEVPVQKSIDNFEITFLFECDGVKIYRFYDASHYRYFSTGKGTFIPSVQLQTNGKVHDTWCDGVDEVVEREKTTDK